MGKKTNSTTSSSVNKASEDAINRFRSLKKNKSSVNDLYSGILNGESVALSQGITLIESTQVTHQDAAQILIEKCLPHANASIRIGITGVPGVGKSTFIESFGMYLIRSLNKRIAVLTVDPSSSISKGAILGDKTRMQSLVQSSKAFVRPSPSGESLGGVARKTRESIILCEAAGYDIILIETVGVGQSETMVHGMVDFFLLLKLAGAGDELQGIKRGIIEMADGIVITKADGDNMNRTLLAQKQFQQALQLYPKKKSGCAVEVLSCSAISGTGIQSIWKIIQRYIDTTKANNYFESNRIKQNENWLTQTIEYQLKKRFYEHKKVKIALPSQMDAMKNQKITPFAAAKYLTKLSQKDNK